MFRRGQVAVVGIGERDGESGRVAFFQLQADFNEDFGGNRGDVQIADFHDLERCGDFGGKLGQQHGFTRIDLLHRFHARKEFGALHHFAGLLDLILGRDAQTQLDLLLRDGERDGIGVLQLFHRHRDGLRDIIRDDLNAAIRRLLLLAAAEVDVVDVAAGAIRHDADEFRPRAEQLADPHRESAKVVR